MSDEEEQNDTEKKALMTLSIELGDKKKQLLNIFLDSKPEQLAYDFCLQNNLDFDSMQNLTEEIKNALANYKADSSNQELKNQSNEENVQKIEKEEKEENIENNDNSNNKEEENEIEYKNEEVSEGHNNQEQEQEIEQEQEQEQEEQEQEKEEKNIEKEIEKSNDEKKDEHMNQEKEEKHEEEINKEEINKEEREISEKKKLIENNNEIESNENNNIEKEQKTEKENASQENEKAEEELVKEEECDKVLEQNDEAINSKEKEDNEENEEESEDNEDIPSYLSPTICFENKKRQKVEEQPKPEFSDFDTSYKKIDKLSEYNKEKNEKVIDHLIINLNNQKYLPKDYYDNPENKNFGERLYNREKIKKEEAMDKARQKVKKENKKIEENITFTPKINDYNLISLQNRRQNKMQYNEERRILNYKDYLLAKEENTRKKHFADIEKENTFAPKIDKNSEKMAGNRSLNIPKYEELYKKKVDMKKLENKIYDNKNMFKPKINKNYKGIKTENKNMNDYANLTFEERQKRFKERMEQNKEKLTEIKNANVDQKTGKKYFKPTVNKNTKLEIQRKNKKVFNELYRDSTKYKIKKEELVKKINELEKALY